MVPTPAGDLNRRAAGIVPGARRGVVEDPDVALRDRTALSFLYLPKHDGTGSATAAENPRAQVGPRARGMDGPQRDPAQRGLDRERGGRGRCGSLSRLVPFRRGSGAMALAPGRRGSG